MSWNLVEIAEVMVRAEQRGERFRGSDPPRRHSHGAFLIGGGRRGGGCGDVERDDAVSG